MHTDAETFVCKFAPMDEHQSGARALILQMIADSGLDATKLARRAGLAPSTLTRFLNNDDVTHTLSARTLGKLAKVVSTPIPLDVANSTQTVDRVPIVGYVGAGLEVHSFGEEAHVEYVEAPPGADQFSVAVIVRGESMFPAFWEGDVLFYTREAGFDRSECLYNECIVRVLDGSVYVKRVMPGSEQNLFTLQSYNAPDMLDIAIEWAAPVLIHDKRKRRWKGSR